MRTPFGIIKLRYTNHAEERLKQRNIPRYNNLPSSELKVLHEDANAFRVKYRYMHMVIKCLSEVNNVWLVISVWFDKSFL